MRDFFRFFVERNLLAYLITCLIVLLGLSTLTHIKRDKFPNAALDEMLIGTAYPGASPEDVELNVTNKIEKEIKNVVGIKQYLSFSRENNSLIWVQIDPNESDKEKVKDEVREAVNRVVDFPQEVTDFPLITEIDTGVFPVIEVGLTADMPYSQLREIARLFEKQLEQLPGVADIDRQGYRDREVRIEISPTEIKKHEVSLAQVIEAIQKRNIRSTGGSFESYTSEKNIVTLAQFKRPEEVGDVIVQATFYGPAIKVKDIGKIVNDFEEEKIQTRINSKTAISFVVNKNSSADIIRTVEAVKALVEKHRDGLLKDIDILYSNDSSTGVKNRLDIVMLNGGLGLILVMLVLSIFLNRRTAFWVAVGVPISILGTIFLLPIFDVYLDGITLMAMVIVIGIIVDDAIIISENIYHRYEMGDSAVDACVNGVHEVFKPVITTILTTFVAFAPMFFIPGTMGKFVYVIPTVITLALFVSLIESTLALPAHLCPALKKIKPEQASIDSEKLFLRIKDKFSIGMRSVLKYRYIFILMFIGIMASSIIYAIKNMEFVLFPKAGTERVSIYVTTPAGSSLQATSEKLKELEKIVNSLPASELESFTTKIGTYGGIGSSESENRAVINIQLTPDGSRDRDAAVIIADMKKLSDSLPGFEEINYREVVGGPPVGDPIQLRVVGSDDEKRRRLANDVVAFLESFKGARDIEMDDRDGKEQIEIKLDYEKLARAELTVEDIAFTARIAFDGQIVTNVRYGDEDVDFRVTLDKSIRSNLDYLRNLQVLNRSGRLIDLNKVAHLEVGPGKFNYNHYNGERSITITGDVDKDMTSALAVAKAVKQHFDVNQDYLGMQLIVSGEAEETEQSQKDILRSFIIAIIGIYFLLMLLFNSALQPLMVLVAVPFGITGVIITFALHDQQLGFIAMTGVIGLAGVVVNDSLVLVNHVNELRRQNPQSNILAIVAQGTSDRLRAILITTISTVAGLLPLAYGIGGSDPTMAPMALALGYGLFFATPLTLVLVPCLYVAGQDIGNIMTSIINKFNFSKTSV